MAGLTSDVSSDILKGEVVWLVYCSPMLAVRLSALSLGLKTAAYGIFVSIWNCACEACEFGHYGSIVGLCSVPQH